MTQVFTYKCFNEDATESLARQMAQLTQKGDVWALFGTLGMGKSVWSRAFIKHLTAANEVPSPTFTLVQTYEAENFDIYHYDLYRLKSPEEIWELNIEEAMYGGVCLIEWPEKMGGYLPKNVFVVEITSLDDGGRCFKIKTNSAEKALRLLSGDLQPDEKNEQPEA